jgi:hypothetical protein
LGHLHAPVEAAGHAYHVALGYKKIIYYSLSLFVKPAMVAEPSIVACRGATPYPDQEKQES